MSKSHPLVPVGDFCYRWDDPLPGQEPPPGWRIVQVDCPYWRRTDEGTVRCELTGQEEWDFGPQYDAALQQGGWQLAHAMHPPPSHLQDQMKTCGINTAGGVYEYLEDAEGCFTSALDERLDRRIDMPPGPRLGDVAVGQFVWHAEYGCGLVNERHDDYRGHGRAALVLFNSDVGERLVLLARGLLFDDPNGPA